jgi:hypothetical protein
MSGTIDSFIFNNITLGSTSYPTPLTITATGGVLPSYMGLQSPGILVPGLLDGSIFNDGVVYGAPGGGLGAGAGIDIGAGAVLTLSGSGTINGATGSDGNIGQEGGVGVSLGDGARFVNAGNRINGGPSGVGSGYVPGSGNLHSYYAKRGGTGLFLGTNATAQNAGLIIGGHGGYAYYRGGTGGTGAAVSNGATLDNQGTIIAGYGGAAGYVSNAAFNNGYGGIGVDVFAGGSLSNSGLIIGGSGQSNSGDSSPGGTGVEIEGGGYAVNQDDGTIVGGNGGASVAFAPGFSARGGAGVELTTTIANGVTLAGTFLNEGVVIGGAGGYGGNGFGGTGGDGLGIALQQTVVNNGTITGGAGGEGFMNGVIGGGAGGVGVNQGGQSTFINNLLVKGGDGGYSGGVGGYGIAVTGTGAVAENAGAIVGGDGGYRSDISGVGGDGLVLRGGTVTNDADGLFQGGAGGISRPGLTGAGRGGYGAYVYNNFTRSTLINHGVITGGAGVTAGGVGVILATAADATFQGTLITDGTISGGMGTVQADAVLFTDGGELVVEAGAVFNGLVKGSGFTTETLALGGSVAGSLSGIGTEFLFFDTLDFLPGVDWTAEGNEAGLAGTIVIDGFSAGDAIILDGFTATSQTYISGTGLELSDGTSSVTLDIEGMFSTSNFLITDIGAGTEIQLLCFLEGTRILTPTGERQVEALRIGDLVMTRFSGMQRIKWIGRQSHAATLARDDAGKRPVCIKAGALGAGQPARDLYVSPGHAMLVEGNLLLASLLVNGVTVTQDWCPDMVEYYQIELETHDCVVAEGAFAETYADQGEMRGQFGNAASFYALYPDYRPPEALSLCAPRPEAGRRLEAALRPVVARAAVAPGRLTGWLDRISAPWTVEGWVLDEAHPELPVLLEFLLDGESLGTALACHFRPDVIAAGHATSGRHGFYWIAPRNLPADAAARLHIRRVSDGAVLPGSAELVGPVRLVDWAKRRAA